MGEASKLLTGLLEAAGIKVQGVVVGVCGPCMSARACWSVVLLYLGTVIIRVASRNLS